MKLEGSLWPCSPPLRPGRKEEAVETSAWPPPPLPQGGGQAGGPHSMPATEPLPSGQRGRRSSEQLLWPCTVGKLVPLGSGPERRVRGGAAGKSTGGEKEGLLGFWGTMLGTGCLERAPQAASIALFLSILSSQQQQPAEAGQVESVAGPESCSTAGSRAGVSQQPAQGKHLAGEGAPPLKAGEPRGGEGMGQLPLLLASSAQAGFLCPSPPRAPSFQPAS